MEAASPPRLEVVFDCDALSAELTWTRARGEFIDYRIFRRAEDDPGAFQVHRVTDIDDTTFVDTDLEPQTRYTYSVETKSATVSARSARFGGVRTLYFDIAVAKQTTRPCLATGIWSCGRWISTLGSWNS